MTDTTLLQRINARMHTGLCPSAGWLGECPAIIEATLRETFFGPRVLVRAVLSLWREGFNDSVEVAAWFTAEGALETEIVHTLHDPLNEIADGVDPSGARQWVVDAWFPVGHPSVVAITEGTAPPQAAAQGAA